MISVILPTYNEAKNVVVLVRQLAEKLPKDSEIIVVDDDSPDKTWQVAEELTTNYPVRVIRRIGRKGLASAVAEGLDATNGNVLVVMDSDLQHDPAVVLNIVKKIEDGADIAVASRYREGGSVGSWVKGRRLISAYSTKLAIVLSPKGVTDPLSGFFAVKKPVYQNIRNRLKPRGFKILLEILANLPHTATVEEVPLVFLPRSQGKSKLSTAVGMAYIAQVARLYVVRFRLMRWVFILLSALIVLLLVPRVFALIPLYTDGDLRAQTQTALRRIADERGWVLSDISLRRVSSAELLLEHRRHRRGKDPVDCYTWSFTASDLAPCDED